MLLVVARARCRHRGNYKRLHDMSVDAQYAARGTIASLGVAHTCLAVDFAEKVKQMYLVLIDSHSKWIEVFPMTSSTSTKTIECLRLRFVTYGVPEQLVLDNGPQFTSDEFRQFVSTNGTKHTLVPAYHPSSNGAAERSVQILKQSLEKQVFEGVYGSLNRLSHFLPLYRSTPHSFHYW